MLVKYEDRVVKYCRFVFNNNKLYKYNKYWIDTKGLETIECRNDLFNVEVDLYPKTIKLSDELKKLGINPPPVFTINPPKKPLPTVDNYQVESTKYTIALAQYNYLRKQNKQLWDNYKTQVYKIIKKDITNSKLKNIKPIILLINKAYIEKENKHIEKHYVKIKNNKK